MDSLKPELAKASIIAQKALYFAMMVYKNGSNRETIQPWQERFQCLVGADPKRMHHMVLWVSEALDGQNELLLAVLAADKEVGPEPIIQMLRALQPHYDGYIPFLPGSM